MSPSHWACYWIIVERMYQKASNVPNGAKLNLSFFFQVSCYLIIFTTSFVDGVWFEALSWYQSVLVVNWFVGRSSQPAILWEIIKCVFFFPGWCKISSLDEYGALMWIILPFCFFNQDLEVKVLNIFHYLLYYTFMNCVFSLMDFDCTDRYHDTWLSPFLNGDKINVIIP